MARRRSHGGSEFVDFGIGSLSSLSEIIVTAKGAATKF